MKILLTFAFLFGVIICNGQAHHLDKDTSKFNDDPLLILKLSQLSSRPTSNLIINTNDIDSINVYKAPTSVALYGNRGANGVIEVVLKRGVNLLNFNEMITAYGIRAADSNLQVFIDSAIAYNPKNTCFEPAAIKYVKIETEQDTGLRYISVRSIYDVKRANKDAIYIRGKATDIKLVD